MVHPGKAAAILAGIGGRIVDGQIHIAGGFEPIGHRAGTIGDRLGREMERRGRKPYDMVGNVAVIPIEGSLVHKGSFVESESGETSYQGIQTAVTRAAADNAVKAVVFEIDSYGGEVSGAFETSDMIFGLSKLKPTLSILSDSAYSAGYLMAAAARQVVIPEQGGAGSIGVITMHTDMSRAIDAAGLTVTILAAGSHKADGNPFEPLPDGVKNTILAEIEEARRVFAGRLGLYRGSRLTFEKAMTTEADSYIGTEAVRRGLADATGHPSEAFRAFLSAVNRA
jgi:ClpP class serine protease